MFGKLLLFIYMGPLPSLSKSLGFVSRLRCFPITTTIWAYAQFDASVLGRFAVHDVIDDLWHLVLHKVHTLIGEVARW